MRLAHAALVLLLLVTLAIPAALAAPAAPAAAQQRWQTVAEQSGFETTGRYDEVERLCRQIASDEPRRVRCEEFGTTPEGRPMLCLVASEDGALTPEAAREKRRTVVLAQGGIHAGEIDGKDAGLLALRQALLGEEAEGALAKVTFVFVPVFNVDGHERFGPNNRPNQAGPAEMGFRTTAQNLNLNRDFAKLDAPETRALVALLDRWDPEIFLDLHVTDGAHFQADVGVMIEPAEAGPLPLRDPARKLRGDVLKRLSDGGHLPLPFYPSFIDGDDPSSGTAVNAFGPRFAHGYWGWRERLGLLVETHSWKPYPVRVDATRLVILAVLEAAARDGAAWREAARSAEALAEGTAGSRIPLAFEASKSSRAIEFPGVRFERRPSAVSGALLTRYHPDEPQAWTIPLFDELVPSVTANAPRGGYVVPAAFAADFGERLALHGIRFGRLPSPQRVEGESWRAESVTYGATTFEGRAQPVAKGAWSKDARVLPQGSLFVPIAQPGARLLVMLMDPAGPDSFFQWGFFDAWLERKEYMEPYVAEEVAERMLAADPALAAEFARKLATEPAFAKDPAARLDFFYRRHPSWDDRMNVSPVMRTDAVLETEPAAAASPATERRRPAR